VPRKPDFQIRKPQELFAGRDRHAFGTNELIYVEPSANLIDYAYDARSHSLEVAVGVNRDQTITLAGPQAGTGQRVRLSNYKWLSRAIRLKDSTGWAKIGSTVTLPRKEGATEEHTLTLLLGLLLNTEAAGGEASLKSELTATLQGLIIYDAEHDLILAEWTRQAEAAPQPSDEKPATE
jgi:hypothetical protein